ncbi:hypothetical protein [Allobaculum sp. Allo2]|uniref:hypothetical protein n=2 Tax=Erysipelotrichaceae TaxID=128827 RepID=UPI001F621356|nr:hypothetical protein [Allobaculum sp. Allo2]UNT94045.1 hypothetical protein KWG61_05185 [Allobaculum sp. Allo2]
MEGHVMNEEQAHVQFLKDKAQSLGLTFEQYMLFLIFENIEHSPYFNTPAPVLQKELWQN